MIVGDIFTMGNIYRKRTFMQWLRNEPRQLQQYQVTAVTDSLTMYEALL